MTSAPDVQLDDVQVVRRGLPTLFMHSSRGKKHILQKPVANLYVEEALTALARLEERLEGAERTIAAARRELARASDVTVDRTRIIGNTDLILQGPWRPIARPAPEERRFGKDGGE